MIEEGVHFQPSIGGQFSPVADSPKWGADTGDRISGERQVALGLSVMPVGRAGYHPDKVLTISDPAARSAPAFDVKEDGRGELIYPDIAALN